MAKKDKHGRTEESYRAEAEVIGARLPKGSDLTAIRRAIVDQGQRNLRHNTQIKEGKLRGPWATRGNSCQCH